MTFSGITYLCMLITVCKDHKFEISTLRTIVMRYGGMIAVEHKQLLIEQMQKFGHLRCDMLQLYVCGVCGACLNCIGC